MPEESSQQWPILTSEEVPLCSGCHFRMPYILDERVEVVPNKSFCHVLKIMEHALAKGKLPPITPPEGSNVPDSCPKSFILRLLGVVRLMP